jgi:hypothetical protein
MIASEFRKRRHSYHPILAASVVCLALGIILFFTERMIINHAACQSILTRPSQSTLRHIPLGNGLDGYRSEGR